MAVDTSSTNGKYVYLSQQARNTNQSSDTFDSYVRFVSSGGYCYRTLAQFTLPSLSGTISAVKFYVNQKLNLRNNTVNLHQLTRSNWTEAGATWNKYDGTNAWTAAGGDYNATVISHLDLTNTTGWKAFPVMGAGADNSLTLDWGNTVGLLLKLATESGSDKYVDFYPKQYSTANLRPYLEITYTTTSIKTIDGLAVGSVKTAKGLAIGSVKTYNGLG